MRFPYREIEPGKFGPVVDVKLKGVTRFYLFEAFVDSGADFSIFDVSSAQIVGLDYKRGKKIPVTVGDGDRIIVYLHQLPVWFAGKRFMAPICFSPGLGSGFNLLGRAGFFERFTICFHEKNRFISVGGSKDYFEKMAGILKTRGKLTRALLETRRLKSK